jgi:hypothetical protein
MIQRCTNPSNSKYAYYGGRGISICSRWVESFAAFLADMGECPGSGYSIDRIDVNGNYEPGNCRWATKKEQSRNTRQIHALSFFGERKSLSEWAERFGLKPTTLKGRLVDGWPIETALQTPVFHQGGGK